MYPGTEPSLSQGGAISKPANQPPVSNTIDKPFDAMPPSRADFFSRRFSRRYNRRHAGHPCIRESWWIVCFRFAVQVLLGLLGLLDR